MRGSDMSPSAMEKAMQPKKTWFFERMGDGKVFACEQKEAWQICFNKSSWKRRDFRLIGTSNGQKFKEIVNSSIKEAQRLSPAIEKLKANLARYMEREEKFILEDVVDMKGDPEDTENELNKKKVLRLRKIMDDIHSELDALEEEFKEKVGQVLLRATAEEQKVAEANQAARIKAAQDAGEDAVLDWPDESLNIKTPVGSHKPRKVIVGLMEGRAS